MRTYSPDCGFIPTEPRFNWLINKQSGWQFGESGVLTAIVNSIRRNGRVAEIGAGNGDNLPVACESLISLGWRADLFEICEQNRAKLSAKYADNSDVKINGGFSVGDKVDCNVLIIDVDGEDYAIMRSLVSMGLLFDVIMIEHSDLNANPQHDLPTDGAMKAGLQARKEHLADLLSSRYVLVGFTRVNSIFVRKNQIFMVERK